MPPAPRQHLLALIATILSFWALKALQPVALPLAYALFFVILFWPLQRRLERVVPRAAAVAVSFVALLAVFAVFVGAVWLAVDEVLEGASGYREEWAALRAQAEALVGQLPGSAADATSGLRRMAERFVGGVWVTVGALVLIVALYVLAMAEVRRWKRKLTQRFSRPLSDEALRAVREVTRQVQRFLLVQSATSVATGVLTGLICWALGVDLALVWGLLALVLNFIPTLGSIVALVPPTLFALLQYGLDWHAPVLFAALAATQLFLGSYVDPKVQGRYLELSAFVVLVAITFWGWLWGVAGAFIAVPITAAAVLACQHVEGAEWVARLLTRADDDVPAKPTSEEPASGASPETERAP